MMKYLQLKFVILFQQKNKFVGKYCFYGCWCFPQAAMFQWQGFGQPVDNIGEIYIIYNNIFYCITIKIVHVGNTQHVSIVFTISSCWVNDVTNGTWHIIISRDHKTRTLEKSRFFAQILLVHVSGRDVSVTETSRKNLHFTKTNGTKWIITNGLSPFSTGNFKVQMTIYVTHF